jgi:hypothetical protein
MRSIKLITSLLLVLFSFSACSKENWISVSDEFYVDSASAKRNGDIAKVTVKYQREVISLDFDCINNKSVDYPTFDMNGTSQLTIGLSKSMKIACSRWFEVWKR